MKIRKLLSHERLILLILLIAAVMRIWRLGINPPHLTPDEAALGYNAFSILKTGRDEYGKLLPIIFKSFGDFKPGLYIYWTVPFVALFGLTEFAVRLPSAVAGVMAVWLAYKIVKILFHNRPLLATLTAFLLAISPWHIHFSRGAWEINLSLTLTLAGIYFFLKSLPKQKKATQKSSKEKFLLFSALFFGLTLITYQGSKLASAIVILILAALYWKQLILINKKILVKSIVLGLLISLPILLSLFQGKTGRLKVFSVFSYRRPPEYLDAQLMQGGEEVGDLTYYSFHSEAYNITRGIFGRWFNHFSTRFLFFEGDWQNLRHSAPNHGVLLLADMILLSFGIYALVKEKSKKTLFIFLWLVLAPLPSALSRDQVHAVRSFNMVIPMTVLSALGLMQILSLIENRRTVILRASFYLALVGAMLVSFGYFLDAYFIHLPVHDSQYWEYGYKQAVKVVNENKYRYDKVHFRQSFAQPYMYYLFFSQYDPKTYQQQANLIESEFGDVGRVEKIDNIFFLPIDWTVNRGDVGTLFVADPIRIPPEDSVSEREFEVVAEIKYLDGKEISQRVIGVKK